MAIKPSVSETELMLLTGAQTPPPLQTSDDIAQDLSCNLTFNSSSTSTPMKSSNVISCREDNILLIGLLPVRTHKVRFLQNKNYKAFKYRSLLKPKSKRVTFQLSSMVVDTNDEEVHINEDNLTIKRTRDLKKEVTKNGKMWKHFKMAKRKGLKLWKIV